MKYQLVVQWPANSTGDYDAIAEVEDMIIGLLSDSNEHEVDGHDVGSGEINIFIHTNDYEKTFDEIKAVLKDCGFWINTRVGYREIGKSAYTPIWPKGLHEFRVI